MDANTLALTLAAIRAATHDDDEAYDAAVERLADLLETDDDEDDEEEEEDDEEDGQ